MEKTSIFLLLAMIACGHKETDAPYIEPEVHTEVQQLITEAAEHGVQLDLKNVTIRWMDTAEELSELSTEKHLVTGLCYVSKYHVRIRYLNIRRKSGVERTIALHRGHWDDYSIPLRKYLLLHEIGHCVYGFEHVDKLENGADIMNPVLPNESESWAYEIDAARFWMRVPPG